MYNTDMPSRAELPTSGQLVRSTLIAATVAAALLVTVVLPAEYGIDPTGAGQVLGLTQTGELKSQLHDVAEADRVKDQGLKAPAAEVPAAPEERSALFGSIFAQLLIGPAAAQTTAAKSEEFSLTLKAGEGGEVK